MDIGTAYGWFDTTVNFSTLDGPFDMSAQMLVATVSTPLDADWSLTGLVGSILRGHLGISRSEPASQLAMSPGGVVGVSLQRTWIPQTALAPFLSTSFKLACSFVPRVGQQQEPLLALDLRASITVGKTIANVVTPYLSARLFGGPIVWFRQSQTVWGTDIYHAQLAVGVTLEIPLSSGTALIMSLDASPLLERSVSASMTLAL